MRNSNSYSRPSASTLWYTSVLLFLSRKRRTPPQGACLQAILGGLVFGSRFLRAVSPVPSATVLAILLHPLDYRAHAEFRIAPEPPSVRLDPLRALWRWRRQRHIEDRKRLPFA